KTGVNRTLDVSYSSERRNTSAPCKKRLAVASSFQWSVSLNSSINVIPGQLILHLALHQRVGSTPPGEDAASRSKAATPTNPPPTMQKICRQISDGTASLVMP